MRLLLKLSGEVLGGQTGLGLDPDALRGFAQTIASIAQKHEIAIVTGGGNIMRGKTAVGLDRAKADQIGMMATVVNCMTLEQYLIAQNTPAIAMSSVAALAQHYDVVRAREYLQKGYVVLVAGGTSNPYFTTDSAAALRALELKCDLLLKATKVDGIYDSDPAKNPNAKRFEQISFDDAIARGLAVMDLTAMVLCRDNHLPLRVCSVNDLPDFDSVIRDNSKSTRVF